MLPKINPSTTNAWNNLSAHAEEMKKVHLRDLFKNDPDFDFDAFNHDEVSEELNGTESPVVQEKVEPKAEEEVSPIVASSTNTASSEEVDKW